ncbi:O-antigen ligase family protein [Clostridium sp.]|jgi:putative inorganic carbon (hco3(-)) transporter|uniref:O-antigen ligase family protein n=1 Tax=Clostridium sp. TaxID=1506 RepID=UPI0039F5AD4E
MKNKLLCCLLYLYLICQAVIPTKFKLNGTIFYGDIVLFAIILVYLISILIYSDTRKRFITGLIDFFTSYWSIEMVLLAVIMGISTVYAVDKMLSISETIRFTLYIIIYFIIKYEVNSKMVIDNMLKLYISVCVMVSAFGILQYFTKIGLDKKFIYYGKGLSVDFRITSTMDNPNSLGAFLALSLFPLIALTIYEEVRIKKLLYAGATLIILSSIILSMSRNTWLGVLIGMVLIIIMYNWRGIILLILGIGSSLIIPQVRHRIKDFSSLLDDPRIKMWKIAVKMIKDHPILGVGNGNYTVLYGDYIKKYPQLKYGIYNEFPSHNSYLKIQSELGIPGISIFILMLLSILIRIKKMINVINDKFYKEFYRGFFVSVIVFFIMNISDNLFFVPKISMYFWILVAIFERIIYNSNCQNSAY